MRHWILAFTLAALVTAGLIIIVSTPSGKTNPRVYEMSFVVEEMMGDSKKEAGVRPGFFVVRPV